MRQLTGVLIFSFLCLLPFKVNGKVKELICPSGSTACQSKGTCVPDDTYQNDCPLDMQALPKKEGAVYSLEEGAMVKCEGNNKLVPLHPQNPENSYWICRSPKDIRPSEK